MLCWYNFAYACSALGTWVFSVAGALLAIPVGIKRKSFAPLVFFGTTGTMLDIIMGISQCEREHAERQMKLLEAQNLAANASIEGESLTDSFANVDKWNVSWCGFFFHEFLSLIVDGPLETLLFFLFPNNVYWRNDQCESVFVKMTMERPCESLMCSWGCWHVIMLD